MRRREFITFVGGAVAWPFAVSVQQSRKVWRIGFLAGRERPTNFEGTAYSAFLRGMRESGRGMRESGYVENQDFSVEWRFAEGRYELFPSLADELVRASVDVIVVGLTAAIPFVQRATDIIPIVMAVASDPVGNGYVTSLARPTGNVTGLASSEDEVVSKQVQFVALLLPNLRRVGFLLNRDNPNHLSGSKILQNTAQQSNLTVVEAEVRKGQDITDAFATLSRERVDVVMTTGDAVLFSHRHQIAEIALKLGLPTIFSQREYVEAGSLMSYGASLADFYRRAAFQIFYYGQPQDRGETWIKRPSAIARFGRRGDRVNVRYWPLAYIPFCTADVRFRGVKQIYGFAQMSACDPKRTCIAPFRMPD